jgi:hypothetical protein|tara:strand:+ start:126 stop:899 length:774 start_codon:yes stop_codon:yes gene_type:complete
MENIKRKLLIKKDKKSSDLVNFASSVDETSIIFSGDENDDFLKIIKKSLEESLSIKRKIDSEIINMEGLSGRKYRSLINNLVQKIKDPSYLEIGTWLGSTACSAAFKNDLKITCIDNWSQILFHEDFPDPEAVFKKNIEKYLSKNTNYTFINNDFRKINYESIGKHNIYLFDGPHHYEDHFEGVTIAQPALSEKYIFIVDDWNWDQVRDGTTAAIKHLKLNVISKLEIRTTHDGSNALAFGQNSDWHQGYCFFVIKK